MRFFEIFFFYAVLYFLEGITQPILTQFNGVYLKKVRIFHGIIFSVSNSAKKAGISPRFWLDIVHFGNFD